MNFFFFFFINAKHVRRRICGVLCFNFIPLGDSYIRFFRFFALSVSHQNVIFTKSCFSQ